MIAEIRSTLVADLLLGFNGDPLGEGYTVVYPVHEFWPDRFTAPCAVVSPPPGRYVSAGKTFGEYEIRMQVLLLVEHKAANTALESLEGHIETVLANTGDWGLEGVDTPGIVTINATEYLGTVITLNKLSR